MILQSNYPTEYYIFLFYKINFKSKKTYIFYSLDLKFLYSYKFQIIKKKYFKTESLKFLYSYSCLNKLFNLKDLKTLEDLYKLKINFYKYYVKKYTALATAPIVNNFSFTQRMLPTQRLLQIFWYKFFVFYFKKNYFNINLKIFQNLNIFLEKSSYIKTINNVNSSKFLYFFNLKKPIFKKIFNMRLFYWNIFTTKQRTKRRYFKFINTLIIDQNSLTLQKYQIFYILRQLEFIKSWSHLTLLLKLELIWVNKQLLQPNYQLKVGDIIECIFGPILRYYYKKLYKINLKHLLRTKRRLYIQTFRQQILKKQKVPKSFKLLSYQQTGGLSFCSFDYTLNIVCVVRNPPTLNLNYKEYYNNISLLKLNKWRYNV